MNGGDDAPMLRLEGGGDENTGPLTGDLRVNEKRQQKEWTSNDAIQYAVHEFSLYDLAFTNG